MAKETREGLLASGTAAAIEESVGDVLGERGFERAELELPRPGSVARSEARFFDVASLSPTLTLVREWTGYSDATAWGVALELAEGLPPAARMEMALPPALSVLARALSRHGTVVGFAVRARPWHLVTVAFREGRAVDVMTAIPDRVVVGAQGQARQASAGEIRSHLDQWLTPHGLATDAAEAILGERDLPSTWRLAYLHASADSDFQ